MFRWYASAEKCYAYLEDVYNDANRMGTFENFAKSGWFARGWTLQELIAPKDVQFFDRKWNFITRRTDKSVFIQDITGIPKELLQNATPVTAEVLSEYSIAARISWAADRTTTRLEDRAYSLLGLLQVNMPLLYGEGAASFRRLQEEILKVSADLSVLAWQRSRRDLDSSRPNDLLAKSPNEFRKCRELVLTKARVSSVFAHETTLSNAALRTKASLIWMKLPTFEDKLLYMILPCRRRNDFTKILALRLIPGSSYQVPEIQKSQTTVECRCGEGVEKLIWIDAYTAISESTEQPVAIRKSQSLYRDVVRDRTSARTCAYLWLRCSEAFKALQPRIGRVLPIQQIWNESNWTFEIPSSSERIVHGHDYPIKAAILLEHPDFFVEFNHKLEPKRDYDFVYTLSSYTSGSRPQLSKMPAQPVHELHLSEGGAITSRLHIEDIFQLKIAILDIDFVKDRPRSAMKSNQTPSAQ